MHTKEWILADIAVMEKFIAEWWEMYTDKDWLMFEAKTMLRMLNEVLERDFSY